MASKNKGKGRKALAQLRKANALLESELVKQKEQVQRYKASNDAADVALTEARNVLRRFGVFSTDRMPSLGDIIRYSVDFDKAIYERFRWHEAHDIAVKVALQFIKAAGDCAERVLPELHERELAMVAEEFLRGLQNFYTLRIHPRGEGGVVCLDGFQNTQQFSYSSKRELLCILGHLSVAARGGNPLKDTYLPGFTASGQAPAP